MGISSRCNYPRSWDETKQGKLWKALVKYFGIHKSYHTLQREPQIWIWCYLHREMSTWSSWKKINPRKTLVHPLDIHTWSYTLDTDISIYRFCYLHRDIPIWICCLKWNPRKPLGKPIRCLYILPHLVTQGYFRMFMLVKVQTKGYHRDRVMRKTYRDMGNTISLTPLLLFEFQTKKWQGNRTKGKLYSNMDSYKIWGAVVNPVQTSGRIFSPKL